MFLSMCYGKGEKEHRWAYSEHTSLQTHQSGLLSSLQQKESYFPLAQVFLGLEVTLFPLHFHFLVMQGVAAAHFTLKALQEGQYYFLSPSLIIYTACLLL